MITILYKIQAINPGQMRRKLMLCLIVFIPVLALAQSGAYSLTGRIAALSGPTKVYLSYRIDRKNILDSVFVKDRMFEFKGLVDVPLQVTITLEHNGQGYQRFRWNADAIVVYLEKGNITLNATDSIANAVVSGSKLNGEYAKYKTLLFNNNRMNDAVDLANLHATDAQIRDINFRKQILEDYKKISEEREVIQRNYIIKNPDSYISLEALKEIAGLIIDPLKIEPIFKSLSFSLRSSLQGVLFAKMIDEAKSISVGNMAPDFTQNDVNGKAVRLLDYRGKYLLVDFWASWCGPCRAENPAVVTAYATYKDRGFTVLGVSLDRPGKKDDWLAAIKKDGLIWMQVSDLKFWDNAVAKQYGIHSIPQNVLIDPLGRIIAKNLRGEEIGNKLKEIFF